MLQAVRLETAVVTRAVTTAQVLDRDTTCVRRDGLDHFGCFFQESGTRVVRTAGGESILGPGDLQFVDMAQEDCSIAPDGRTAFLYVPRDLVEAEIPQAAHLHGMVFNHVLSRMFSTQLMSLFDREVKWPAEAAGIVERSLFSLGLECLALADPDGLVPRSLANEVSLRRRIERYIDEHLGDRALDVPRITNEFSISRSALYRLFHDRGGVSHYILDRRLRRMRASLLADDRCTIGEMAFTHGFITQSHFSRDFRRAYGETPKTVRLRHGVRNQGAIAATSLDQVIRDMEP